MKLSDFKKLLSQHHGKQIRFALPTGSKIPAHAHVTEVARMEKRFVDCGGTFRTEFSCRLQAWFAEDTDHRLSSGKLLNILEKAACLLETENLEVEVEYEAPFISQFPVSEITAGDESLLVRLGIRHTACLAEDKCLPPALPAKSLLLNPIADLAPSKCCS